MTLSDRYNSIRKHTEHLCTTLKTEDFVPQPADFVSPPKWHLAHTTWIFEQFVLKEHLPDYKIFDDDFSFLFNSYYNFVGKRVFRANRGNITRPGVQEVFEYRSYVDMHMQILLQLKSEELKDLIELGLNHEQQHQELLVTDIKYILGNNPIFPIYDENIDWEKQENEESGFVKMPEGIYEIGFEGEGFSFDNEHGRHKVYLHDFEISKSLVTNAEYLEFILDGGYTNFDYWLDEGWSWITENKIEAPLYWHKIDGVWHQYTVSGLEEISFYEAAAFATWKKMRLPTEFEWEVAADEFNWGKRWEWTNSAYLPYPYFKKPEGAIGEYNGKFMVNQMVLRGASCATPPHHSRKTYRNFFHAHERWQFNGIRLAK